MKKRTAYEVVFLGLIVTFFLVNAAFHLHPILEEKRLPFIVLAPIFFVFTLLHACFMLGWRRAVAFFGIAAVISFLAEFLGTTLSWPFGDYEYTDLIGHKLFGHVPFTIPIIWFMIVYCAYVVTNLIIDRTPLSKPTDIIPKMVWFSFIGGIIATAWDLTLDPYMVEFEKAWIWNFDPDNPPPYFGIPYSNYVGWVGTSLVILLIYRLVEKRIPLRPMGHVNRWIASLPVITYGWLSFSDIILGHPEETVIISPFAIGLPFLIAMTQLCFWEPSSE